MSKAFPPSLYLSALQVFPPEALCFIIYHLQEKSKRAIAVFQALATAFDPCIIYGFLYYSWGVATAASEEALAFTPESPLPSAIVTVYSPTAQQVSILSTKLIFAGNSTLPVVSF